MKDNGTCEDKRCNTLKGDDEHWCNACLDRNLREYQEIDDARQQNARRSQ